MITSFSNEHIKAIRKLQDRKGRDESGLFYIEGLRIVAEAINRRAQIENLVISPALLKSTFAQDLVRKCQMEGTSILEVSSEIFQSLSKKEGPQGIAAVIKQSWLGLEEVKFAKTDGLNSSTWVALDSVADPGNLGTILRTHDGVGGEGVILLDQSTDPFDGSATRASMGALFSQRIVKTSFDQFAEWKRRAGTPVIGTSGAAKIDYTAVKYPQKMILLMGSERHGLLDQHLGVCDMLVSIPMVGTSDSLNLAVATAVMLYEIFNQRRR